MELQVLTQQVLSQLRPEAQTQSYSSAFSFAALPPEVRGVKV